MVLLYLTINFIVSRKVEFIDIVDNSKGIPLMYVFIRIGISYHLVCITNI